MGEALPDRHPRVQESFTVRLEVGERLFMAVAHELSVTGLLVESPVLPPAGELTVAMPIAGQVMKVQARVVRASPRLDGVDLALSFLDLEWDEICAIARAVAAKMPRLA